jgi:hypothetical protein
MSVASPVQVPGGVDRFSGCADVERHTTARSPTLPTIAPAGLIALASALFPASLRTFPPTYAHAVLPLPSKLTPTASPVDVMSEKLWSPPGTVTTFTWPSCQMTIGWSPVPPGYVRPAR